MKTYLGVIQFLVWGGFMEQLVDFLILGKGNIFLHSNTILRIVNVEKKRRDWRADVRLAV